MTRVIKEWNKDRLTDKEVKQVLRKLDLLKKRAPKFAARVLPYYRLVCTEPNFNKVSSIKSCITELINNVKQRIVKERESYTYCSTAYMKVYVEEIGGMLEVGIRFEDDTQFWVDREPYEKP